MLRYISWLQYLKKVLNIVLLTNWPACANGRQVFATLSITAGGETVYDVNTTVRPNKPLLVAFGYQKCADQSVIQQTINSATEENVSQLEEAINRIFKENNQLYLFVENPDEDGVDENPEEQELMTIDIDLSPLPASKASLGSKKGYVAKKKNQYTRLPVPACDEGRQANGRQANWHGYWFLLLLRLSVNLFIMAILFLVLFSKRW